MNNTPKLEERDEELVRLLEMLIETQNGLRISERELAELRQTLAGTTENH